MACPPLLFFLPRVNYHSKFKKSKEKRVGLIRRVLLFFFIL